MSRVTVSTTYEEGEVVQMTVQVDQGPGTTPLFSWEALAFLPVEDQP